jgi:hypothetical protein
MSSSTTSRDSAMNREQAASRTAESHPCNEALISRQRQRYLASLPSEGEVQIDNQYREQ